MPSSAFPPEPQELRARKVGHVILDTPTTAVVAILLLHAGRQRGLCEQISGCHQARGARHLLKSADLCASEPERVARLWSMSGLRQHYDYALQALSDLPYDKWRDYDPEDTIRFYALRHAGGRHHQVKPAQDHRRRHRLAVPQRGQARVEDVSGWPARISAAGAAVPGRRMRMTRRTTSACRRSDRRRTLP